MLPFIFDAKSMIFCAFGIGIDLAFSFLESISESGIDLALRRTTVNVYDSFWE